MAGREVASAARQAAASGSGSPRRHGGGDGPERGWDRAGVPAGRAGRVRHQDGRGAARRATRRHARGARARRHRRPALRGDGRHGAGHPGAVGTGDPRPAAVAVADGAPSRRRRGAGVPSGHRGPRPRSPPGLSRGGCCALAARPRRADPGAARWHDSPGRCSLRPAPPGLAPPGPRARGTGSPGAGTARARGRPEQGFPP